MSSTERVGWRDRSLFVQLLMENTRSYVVTIELGQWEALGSEVIHAGVRSGLFDEETVELFYDSNLNQQFFPEWSCSQKIEAIKYSEKMTGVQFRQGRRTDLEHKIAEGDSGAYVQSRQKLDESSMRDTTRDRMARWLGIATATLSKYKSIIKLPDAVIESIAWLLDHKKITLEAVYLISRLKHSNVKQLVDYMDKSLDR